MSSIPFSYVWRNLRTRKLTTLLTAGGMALVVFVYATVLMLEAGLAETLIATGSPDNVTVIRKGSQTEAQSVVDRNQAAIIESNAHVATDRDGSKLLAKESVVLISLQKRGTVKPANVVIRGTNKAGLVLRPQVQIVQGRMFRPGSAEVIAGRAIAERFQGAGLGETIRFGQRDWVVVALFDAGKTGFNSEIWADSELMMQSFRRSVFSAATFKLTESGQFDAVVKELDADPRLTVEAKRETQFYADQSRVMALFIRYLGVTLSVIFSLGAVIGAMITMYAAVANRVAEVGTLRAIGFNRRAVMTAFLVEALLLSLVGGVVGLVLASGMQFFTISTMNWQTFSELAFSFSLTPGIVIKALIFSLIMGLLGGFLPAARAARLNIVDALRAG
ncbi:ABC transporter permease [Permianibacter sp. IMCC34836]|uniref:ABC transporter permease n=1 Tax=Permianibacter fluminis TaxID=2738515 RepID=UPI001552EEB2|nr:ABC transporter permease [Permianibacter fluminis]NQD36955.1 ABC transporter permease [Permianibacter fluminis]